ncbi:hypothetical protein Bbelb_198710 [Branchiostoma belcheri]|nr:hypothetical protein Bbelb_198710 [Branchiostoma belcheri]
MEVLFLQNFRKNRCAGWQGKQMCGVEAAPARFNLSPQEGYTKDVGKKSSMMVLNTLMSHKAYDLFNTTGGNREARLRDMFKTADNAILFFPKSNRFWWMYRGLEQILRRQGLNVVVVMGVTTFEHGHDEIRRKIWEVLDKQNTREMPSTGLLLVEIAITFCDRIQVYGFYPFARDQQDHAIPFYYWDTPDSDLGAGHIHNFAAEFELLRKLHNNGVIEHKIGTYSQTPDENLSVSLVSFRPLPKVRSPPTGGADEI